MVVMQPTLLLGRKISYYPPEPIPIPDDDVFTEEHIGRVADWLQPFSYNTRRHELNEVIQNRETQSN